MGMPLKDGSTTLENLLSVDKVLNGKAVPELEEYRAKEYPLEFFEVWNDFLSINQRRQFTESGPCSFTSQEVKAWLFLFGVEMSPFLIDIVFQLDSIWMRAWSKQASKNNRK